MTVLPLWYPVTPEDLEAILLGDGYKYNPRFSPPKNVVGLPLSLSTRGQAEVLLCVVNKEHLACALRVVSGKRALTAQRGAEVLETLPLSIAVGPLLSGLPATIRQALEKVVSASKAKRLPRDLWEAIVAHIRSRHAAEHDRLMELLQRAGPKGSASSLARSVRTLERDAMSIALRTLTTDYSQVLREWVHKDDDDDGHYLAGLPRGRYGEVEIINHDSTVAALGGDWLPVEKSWRRLSAEFRSGNRSIVVTNVNNLPAERTLGVDMIYYNERYDAFTLVQYKCLNDCEESQLDEAFFRATGSSNFWRQLAIMRHEMEAWPVEPADDIHQYRLSQERFYFKFCRKFQPDGATSKLMDGYYLPFSMIDAIADTTTQIAKIGLAPLGRGISNSLFVNLVRDGWIGSRGSSTQRVDEVTRMRSFLRNSVDHGRSVVVVTAHGVGEGTR